MDVLPDAITCSALRGAFQMPPRGRSGHEWCSRMSEEKKVFLSWEYRFPQIGLLLREIDDACGDLALTFVSTVAPAVLRGCNAFQMLLEISGPC